MFLMILFHHETSIASYVRINEGTKGQKQASIGTKQERRKIHSNTSMKQSPNKFKTASQNCVYLWPRFFGKNGTRE